MSFLDGILNMGSTVVPHADSGQKGKGLFTGDFISSAIEAALGIYGIYQNQQNQNAVLQQQSAQADDAYQQSQEMLQLRKDELAQQKELAEAELAAQKQATLQGAYRNYLESIAGARRDTQEGYANLSDAMTRPLNYLIARR